MSAPPTLDEWVERAGFARLRDQIECHAKQWVGAAEAPRLARLCMISLREEIEAAPDPGEFEWDPRWPEHEIDRHLAGPYDKRLWRGRLVAIEEVRR